MSVFIADITTFLDRLGVSYKFYSDILPKEEATSKPTVDPSEIVINEIYSEDSLSTARPAKASTIYYYIPVSGTSFVDPDKAKVLCAAYQLLDSTGQSYPPLVGINKRSQALIKNNPNFILFESVAQDLLNDHVFISYSDEERETVERITNGIMSYSHRKIISNPSHELASVYALYNKYSNLTTYRDLSTYIQQASTQFTFRYLEVLSPIDYQTFKTRYPLLNDYYSTCLSQEALDHYFKLETYYDPTPITTRRHTYVNLADPDDHDYTLPPELREDTQPTI